MEIISPNIITKNRSELRTYEKAVLSDNILIVILLISITIIVVGKPAVKWLTVYYIAEMSDSKTPKIFLLSVSLLGKTIILNLSHGNIDSFI